MADENIDPTVLDSLQQFLIDNELPLSLMDFVKQALIDQKPFSEVINDLRQTPEYQAAYPENKIRQDNGFSFQPEAYIRNYRDEAKRLGLQYLNYAPSNTEIANAIGKDKSLTELESFLQAQVQASKYGDTVKALFYQELGYTPSDERILAFMHPEISTPELDRAYNAARMRGQAESLGLGTRPEDEAAALLAFGLDPDKVFQNYQGIAAELPRAERLAAIEAHMHKNSAQFPSASQALKDASFGTLFRAIQFGDQTALKQLQGLLQREAARFATGGGVARTGSGAATGLLTQSQRDALG